MVGSLRRLLGLAVVVGTVCCGPDDKAKPAAPTQAMLRVGVAQLSANAAQGLQQLAQIFAVENLARAGEDGRMQPWLAESLTLSNDGRTLTVQLRPNVRFHDGSTLDAATVAAHLQTALRPALGPVFSDVDHVKASGPLAIEITFRRPSPFLTESLWEVPIQKPGTGLVGTGPFQVPAGSTTEIQANQNYYLPPPVLSGIEVKTYPSMRGAWAEMLRDNLDMLWEVSPDAFELMKNGKNVSVFRFTRKYQHAIAFNPDAPALRSANVRRALSLALDREAVVRNALNGAGVASSGPIWAQHWAMPANLPQFGYDPKTAADLVQTEGKGKALRFTCLVSSDLIEERIALEVKRQLAAVGVDMAVEEASRDQIIQRGAKHEFEAAVIQVTSGPTLLRPYIMWHSNTPRNWGRLGNTTVDAALDRLRDVRSEDETRAAVVGVQKAFMDDPPGIFLAWSVGSRAVSKRFDVPAAEPGRDILSNLRLWAPASEMRTAHRN